MNKWAKALVCMVLLFSFLFLSVGYAALTDTLTIFGSVNVGVTALFTVTYMIGDEEYAVDYHTDPTQDYTVKGAPNGYSDFKAWVNANGDVVTSIPASNNNNYTLYATWLNKYTINFIDQIGNLIHSEEFTEGATSISSEGQAVVSEWLRLENEKENPNHIYVTWPDYDLTGATTDIIVRPQYDYQGYLNLEPVYEEPDDGVVDYYRVVAVDSLPATVVVPGYVGDVPVKVVDRITNIDGENDWNNYENTVTKIIIEEGVEELGWNALAWTPNLVEVELPSTLKVMGKNVFSRNDLFGNDKKTLTITFKGTMAEWEAIIANSDANGEGGQSWDGGLEAGTVVNCSDGYFKLERSGWSLAWKKYSN